MPLLQLFAIAVAFTWHLSQNLHGSSRRRCMCQPENFVLQIVGVNDINEEVVPFSEASQIIREQDMKGNPLTHLITERSHPPPCVFKSVSVCLSACIYRLLLVRTKKTDSPLRTSSLKGQQGLWGVCVSDCVCPAVCLSACMYRLLLATTQS